MARFSYGRLAFFLTTSARAVCKTVQIYHSHFSPKKSFSPYIKDFYSSMFVINYDRLVIQPGVGTVCSRLFICPDQLLIGTTLNNFLGFILRLTSKVLYLIIWLGPYPCHDKASFLLGKPSSAAKLEI